MRLNWTYFIFNEALKEISHGMLSYFGRVQNYHYIIENLKIKVYR